jgi:RNA polymerase sigma-70 factor, ECF subfamily
VVEKTPSNVRQIAKRAREHVGDANRRHDIDEEERQRLAAAFLAAAGAGDMDGLRELLAADAIMYTDGGGVVTAARKPIYGADKISRFMVRVQRKDDFPADPVFTPVLVNGDPGVLMESAAEGFVSIAAIEVGNGAIQTVRFFNNPERFPVEFPAGSHT